MNQKSADLEIIQKLLTSPDIEFVIQYWDRAKDEPSPFEFHIGGKKETP